MSELGFFFKNPKKYPLMEVHSEEIKYCCCTNLDFYVKKAHGRVFKPLTALSSCVFHKVNLPFVCIMCACNHTGGVIHILPLVSHFSTDQHLVERTRKNTRQ